VTEQLRFESYLDMAASRTPELLPVCQTVFAIADAGRRIARILARGPLAGELSAIVGDSIDGDGQKALDALTHTMVRDALASCPVASFASEEAEAAEILNPQGSLAVAVDPLDGSSNIDTLAPVGTIFSIMPMPSAAESPDAPFLKSGRNQLAAGYLIYGPQTALVLTLGDGTRIFSLDPESGAFISIGGVVKIPEATREYAINGSNFRHWEQEVRNYITELLLGTDGPRNKDFNTRWLASMVGDAYRILRRGGVYIYPGDHRKGYAQGRLRLIYEANPIAMIVEQAGGAATDGRHPILDIVPTEIHQRCPLIFGSSDEVQQIANAYAAGSTTKLPLFKNRSLFRKSTNMFESFS
jgi:fructose-1,6-bisphosphatase I